MVGMTYSTNMTVAFLLHAHGFSVVAVEFLIRHGPSSMSIPDPILEQPGPLDNFRLSNIAIPRKKKTYPFIHRITGSVFGSF